MSTHFDKKPDRTPPFVYVKRFVAVLCGLIALTCAYAAITEDGGQVALWSIAGGAVAVGCWLWG